MIIWSELNPDGDFIFERNGERLTARTVTYWLNKYCRDAGINTKVFFAQEGQLQAVWVRKECPRIR